MADIKRIQVDGVEHDIHDAVARSKIGDLNGLETTEKSDLVSAINEAAKSGSSGGGVSSWDDLPDKPFDEEGHILETAIPDTIARTADVIPAPATASVGQTVAVKAVDENGKPTEWEAADFPTGGGTGSGPVQYIESVDESNLKNLRDLESGTYVLYGYFYPYAGAADTLTCDKTLVSVAHLSAGSHVLVFNPLNCKVNFIEILVDESVEGGFTYSVELIDMRDLPALIAAVGSRDDLATEDKSSIVAAINELAASAGGSGSGGGGSSAQPDWNQNDESAADFVKNRTHFVREAGFDIAWDGDQEAAGTPVFADVMGMSVPYYRVSDMTPSAEEIVLSCKLTMVALENGVPTGESVIPLEEMMSQFDITDDYAYLQYVVVVRKANSQVTGATFPEVGTYFPYITLSETTSGYVSLLSKPSDVVKLDPMYLPDSLVGKHGTGENAEVFNSVENTASGAYSHAEGESTRAYGDHSHAEGHTTTASGGYSHAEGGSTTASGGYSHAEGRVTEAFGESSHAEGNHTFARGNSAHAEGFFAHATGDYSHAEGYYVLAAGNSSHAEGLGHQSSTKVTGEGSSKTYSVSMAAVTNDLLNYFVEYSTNTGEFCVTRIVAVDPNNKTITLAQTLSSDALDSVSVRLYDSVASGECSHIEGWQTVAIGKASHAEGVGTIAGSFYQHVQGKYNIEDTTSKYAHIIGNGTGVLSNTETYRSNAHTVDWDGNAWYAGTVEATGIILKSSTEGSSKRFLVTVDDSGNLTASEITE